MNRVIKQLIKQTQAHNINWIESKKWFTKYYKASFDDLNIVVEIFNSGYGETLSVKINENEIYYHIHCLALWKPSEFKLLKVILKQLNHEIEFKLMP